MQPAAATAAVATPLDSLPIDVPIPDAPAAEVSPAHASRRWFSWKRLFLALFVLVFVSAAGVYSQKDRIAPEVADLSRRIIGDENTARLEGWVFKVEDQVHQWKYKVLGGEENPFAVKEFQLQFVPRTPARQIVFFAGSSAPQGQVLTADLFAPVPFKLPQTHVLLSDPQAGEGAWTTVGLPRNTPGETLMAKTYIRPDKTRPYASVGVLAIDKRRIHLKMVAGTAEPGGERGVKGPGVIPKEDLSSLLVAFNGGFKGPHGGYGMVANGKTYWPMRNGLATICVQKDGTIRMGEYGRDFGWEDSFVSCRQNVILLVDQGSVSRRTTEGNDTWGYVNVNSAEFITWRSAVGVTKDGDLLIAAGNSLSADTLAKALHAAGAYYAMQLDINAPYISTALFYPQPDGAVKAEKFMDSMAPSASNYLGTRERDFFYLVLDERRYR